MLFLFSFSLGGTKVIQKMTQTWTDLKTESQKSESRRLESNASKHWKIVKMIGITLTFMRMFLRRGSASRYDWHRKID